MKYLFLLAVISLSPSARADDSCEDFVQKQLEKNARHLDAAAEAIDHLFADFASLKPTAAALEAKVLKSRPGKNPTCAEIEDSRFLYDAITLKFKFLPKQLEQAKENFNTLAAQKPRLTPRESAAAVSCLRECAMKDSISLFDLKAADACVRDCKVKEKDLDYIQNSDLLSLFFADECLDPSSGELDQKNVARMIDKAETVGKTLTESMERSWKKYYSQTKKLLSKLKPEQAELAARIRKQPPTPDCPGKNTAATMKAATIKLDVEERGSGTGFYVSAPNGKTYLVSARHVPALGGDYDEAIYPAVKPAGKLFTFQVEPGKHDYENDAVIGEAETQEHSLRLAGSEEQPAFGQIFRIGGFPGYAGGNFVSAACRFLGYAPNVNGGMAYVLNCPVDSPVKGMSGGPMMTDDGRVWGIVVNQFEEYGIIVASPLSVDAAGEPKFRIQGSFFSDYCYGPLQLPQAPHRCQIFPGSLEKPVALPNE